MNWVAVLVVVRGGGETTATCEDVDPSIKCLEDKHERSKHENQNEGADFLLMWVGVFPVVKHTTFVSLSSH